MKGRPADGEEEGAIAVEVQDLIRYGFLPEFVGRLVTPASRGSPRPTSST